MLLRVRVELVLPRQVAAVASPAPPARGEPVRPFALVRVPFSLHLCALAISLFFVLTLGSGDSLLSAFDLLAMQFGLLSKQLFSERRSLRLKCFELIFGQR